MSDKDYEKEISLSPFSKKNSPNRSIRCEYLGMTGKESNEGKAIKPGVDRR